MTEKTGAPRGRLRAAWTLVLLTTLCAELTFTAVAVPTAWLLLPLLLVMYGAGVLVVREAVARVGGGWPSLVLLGLAYQLAEDRLGLQALTAVPGPPQPARGVPGVGDHAKIGRHRVRLPLPFRGCPRPHPARSPP